MTAPAANSPFWVIQDAARDAGLIKAGDTLTGEGYATWFRRLNDLVNLYQTKGLKLWLNQDITVPLVDGQATYTFGPSGSIDMTKPLRVLEGFYLYTSGEARRPLIQISLNDYWTLGNSGTLASNRGTISQFVVQKFATQLSVIFWLCPNSIEAAGGAVHLLMQVQVTNAISLTETMNFPLEWRAALVAGLSDVMAVGQPETIMARCAGRAAQTLEALDGWDVEDAPTRFTSDAMYQSQGASRFR